MNPEMLYLYRPEVAFRELAFLIDDEEIGHIGPSIISEATVTGEFEDEVWHVSHHGFRPVRVYTGPAGADIPALVFVGSPSWGLAMTRRGMALRYYSRIDPRRGPGSGFENENGKKVCWIHGRQVPGLGLAYEVELDMLPSRSPDTAALLFTWASFRLLRLRRMIGQLGTIGVRAETVEREMDRILRGFSH